MNADLAEQFRKQVRAFEVLARRTCKAPTPTRVHDLRVLTRRLRALVWVGRRVAGVELLLVLRKRLRKLGRALGERRLYDVAVADARTYQLDAASLAGRREHALQPVLKLLKADRQRRLAALLKRAARGLKAKPLAPLAENLDDLARGLAQALKRAPRGKAEMHELRIAAKKVRYVFEILGRGVGELRDLQGLLGRAHDLEVLQELLGAQARVAADEAKARARAKRKMRGVVARALKTLEAASKALVTQAEPQAEKKAGRSA